MMSIRVVNAGDGYAYLMDSVATHDEHTAGTALSDYYNATGTPPGRWFGRGIDGLGDTTLTVGGIAEEAQMGALYGEGLHPDADARLENGATLSEVQLGRQYPIYTKGVPVLTAVKEAEKKFFTTHGRRPDTEERNVIGLNIARPYYEEAAEVSASTPREVLAWLNDEKNKVRQATSGLDLTFSPQKSVSVLWALGDEQTRTAIEKIHTQCVEESLAWVEDNVLFTRTGSRGERQIKARGMIASTFMHYDTRAGDPDLHTHCLISNKVQAERGQQHLSDADADKWRSIDASVVLKNSARISQRYQQMLTHRLTTELGLDFRPRVTDADKQPVWEIAGISDEMIESFSSRRVMAKPVYEAYAAQYATTHGHAPSDRARYALWQQAILDTRDAKKPGQSLAAHREHWLALNGGQPLNIADLHADVKRELFPEPGTEDYAIAVATLAVDAVDDTRSRRAEFYRRHLDTSISMRLSQWRFTSTEQAEQVRTAAESFAMEHLIATLSVNIAHTLPAALVADNGQTVDHDVDSEKLTAKQTLAEEATVLDSINIPTGFIASRTSVEAALAAHKDKTGFDLNTGQQLLASHLTESGTLVAAGVGPAGTGKTASMSVVADVWRAHGHNVHALAPSSTAAQQLGEDIGADGHTIASLTYRWRGLIGGRPHEVDGLGIDLAPGDMLLVDEAGMATTADLAALVEIAQATGAVVRMVGDPHQLDAVETGGLFRTIVKRDASVELDQVMRMGADKVQADAGLKIRHGDHTGLDLYYERGWVHHGDRSDMIATAARDHLADTSAGRSSILIASTRQDVHAANHIIRDARIEAGLVDTTGRSIELGTGHDVAVGDIILTRRNQTIGEHKILNGQRFHVHAVSDDGSLVVVDEQRQRTVVLPAEYVSEHVQLGYAATVHRAQGVTVDVTRAVIGAETDRRGLYVAVTRGKKQNHLYVAEDTSIDVDAEGGHWHMSGEHHAPDHRAILEKIVATDSGQRSATDLHHDELLHAVSDERKAQLLSTATDLLTAQWRSEVLEPEVRQRLDQLSVHYLESIDEDDAVEKISTAIVRMTGAGTNYREVMDRSFAGLEGSRDVGAVIASRLSQYLPESQAEVRALPPRHYGMDSELYDWAEATREALLARPTRELRELLTPLPDSGVVEGWDLHNVDLRGHDLSNLKFVDCDLQGAALDNTTWHYTNFMNCSMENVTATGAQIGVGDSILRASVIMDSRLDGADFSEVRGESLSIMRSSAHNIVVDGAYLRGSFTSSDFTGVDFEAAEIGELTLAKSVTEDSAQVREREAAQQRELDEMIDSMAQDEDETATTSSEVDDMSGDYFSYEDTGFEL